MNEAVFDMVDTLEARLEDVRNVVAGLSCDVSDYVDKLDKIDDEIYALQLELEKNADVVRASFPDGAAADTESSMVEAPTETGSTDADKAAISKDRKDILSDDMKDTLAEAGRAMGHVLRDSKDVVSELSGTMGEIKDMFSLIPKKHY